MSQKEILLSLYMYMPVSKPCPSFCMGILLSQKRIRLIRDAVANTSNGPFLSFYTLEQIGQLVDVIVRSRIAL